MYGRYTFFSIFRGLELRFRLRFEEEEEEKEEESGLREVWGKDDQGSE